MSVVVLSTNPNILLLIVCELSGLLIVAADAVLLNARIRALLIKLHRADASVDPCPTLYTGEGLLWP
jgi:hypothetical protein